VLLVDDDESLLMVTRKLLERAGHLVVACTSGDDALVALTKQTFDVMISDIQMPGTTGLNLLRAVREHDLDLPVVLVTGNPGVKGAADAVEYGAFRYLVKPVQSVELRAIVLQAIGIGRAARSKREYVEEFGTGRFGFGDRASVDAVLARALSSLWLAYQPIVRTSDLAVVAYEALLRVEEQMLPHPGAVLDAAERVGRIHDVGRAVRRRVVADAKSARDGWQFFVNLHPEDLLDLELYEPTSPLSSLAARTVLEVTERASLDRVSHLQEKMAKLRTLGFQIALDDLGAGYAGLTSFTQLEPEFVKLDMSLVRGVHESTIKQKVIRSMVQLCQDTGKKVIAEGIETPGEQDALIEIGCDFLQGYLFSRPGKPFPTVVGQSPPTLAVAERIVNSNRAE
jgi:EAL domain-containing protein (putative c-di-GMP-specific phosphodiesterase class I)